MAGGLAVVSSDCPSGPSEIIRHEVDGLLVPPEDVDGLAQALDLLMSNEGKRRELAEQARSVVERFSVSLYYDRWESVLCGDDPTSVSSDPNADEAEPC